MRDYAWAYNIESEELELKKITRVYKKETTALLHLYTSTGIIDTTSNHPFYVMGKGWVAVGDIEIGDEIYTLDGSITIVLKWEYEQLSESITVYNLEVEDFNSYFVGSLGVLVHNYKGTEGGSKTTGTYAELVSNGQKDAHHIIQDAAMRDIPGYDRMKAPAIQFDGPSNLVGTEHYNATVTQRRAGGGTYGSERGIAYMSLRKAGISIDEAKSIVRNADKYFMGELGLNLDSPTRIPGNRRRN